MKWGQLFFNVLLFIALGHWAITQATTAYQAGRMDFVEISFVINNALMILLVLIRQAHQAVHTHIGHQAIAMIAFFSGVFFQLDGPVPHPAPALVPIANGITCVVIWTGIITLFNLGRSFGILIAIREVRSTGLYGIIRHPMYAADILMRLGIVLKHPTSLNLMVALLSTGCYVWRAILEERFLVQFEPYKAYMQRVPYRFIPGVI